LSEDPLSEKIEAPDSIETSIEEVETEEPIPMSLQKDGTYHFIIDERSLENLSRLTILDNQFYAVSQFSKHPFKDEWNGKFSNQRKVPNGNLRDRAWLDIAIAPVIARNPVSGDMVQTYEGSATGYVTICLPLEELTGDFSKPAAAMMVNALLLGQKLDASYEGKTQWAKPRYTSDSFAPHAFVQVADPRVGRMRQASGEAMRLSKAVKLHKPLLESVAKGVIRLFYLEKTRQLVIDAWEHHDKAYDIAREFYKVTLSHPANVQNELTDLANQRESVYEQVNTIFDRVRENLPTGLKTYMQKS